MRRVTRNLILAFVALSLLGVPTLALGANPQAGVHQRTHPKRSARVGPVHTITTGAAIDVASSGTVDLVSAVWWIDASAYLNVAGEVVNGMSSRRQFVDVAVTIKDAGGVVVGSTSTYADIDQLAPGMTSSFWRAVPAPPDADSVWVAVGPGSAVATMPQGALQATLGTPYTDTYGWRHYPGTLRNLASFPVEFAQVILTFYGVDGSVVDTDWTYSELDTIPSGDNSPFDVVLYGGNPGAARIGVAAQARSDADYSKYVTSWNNYFNDVGSSAFRSDIIWNAEAGITTGCGAGLFCPAANVPRDQMASFLARALGLTGAAPDAFTDDNGNLHERNINLVAREGIASGCGSGKFCPAVKVARDQMASFLARARSLSGAAPDAFTDDNGNLHETNINLVAREGIATGCGGGKYCPSTLVTREQMAAFLHRAFGSR